MRRVVSSHVLRDILAAWFLGEPAMLESSDGKLLVYASSTMSDGDRFKCISVAAEKMAKLLRLGLEVVTFQEEFTPIYVYYKSGEEEPIPIYCNKGGEPGRREIGEALKNMMFVLSFHPKHPALKQRRAEIMHFS